MDVMDTVSKEKRSQIMSAVKSKETKLEIVFRKAIWNAGFRYRKNCSNYFGKPDIVLHKSNTPIFIDSCFWHGCKKHCRIPAIRQTYWLGKIERNRSRDKEVNEYYKKEKKKVIRVWEHEIKENIEKTLRNVIKRISA